MRDSAQVGDDRRCFRWRAALMLAPLLAAVLGLVTALGATPAAAAPDGTGTLPGSVRARAQAFLARVDQLVAQGEMVAEDYNAAGEELRRLEAQIGGLREEVAVATQRLEAAQKVLNARARSTYMHGSGDELLSMLVLPELAPSTRRVLFDVLESDARAVSDATAARATIAAAERDLVTAIGHQQEVLADLGRRRAELTDLTTRIVAQLRQADPQLRAAVAQLRSESEAQALVDWAAFGGDSSLNPSDRAMTAVRVALAQVGDPYVYGATGPSTFDCSGLMVFSYRAAGVALPRVSRDQYRLGHKVPLTALVPGDLVFWANDTSNPATVHHVAMYIGGGRIVHAPHPGDVVRMATIWQQGLIGAVRPVAGRADGPPPAPITLPPNPPDWPTTPTIQPPPMPPPPAPRPVPSPTPTTPPPSPAPTSPSPSATPSPTPTPTESPTGTPTDTSPATETPSPTDSGTPPAGDPSSTPPP
jgi:cell wall-associated NlpC family hydrolase